MPDTAQSPTAKSRQDTPKTAASAKPGWRPAVFAAVGGLLMVAAVGLVLNNTDLNTGDAAQPTLSSVAQRDLGEAATTLAPSAAGGLVEDAQRCKVPLASMTISKGNAALGSTIRIRSGSYVSPYFNITDSTQRVAVPYPAPYGSGAGTIIIEGNATGAIVGLTPTKRIVELPGSQSIPVTWRVKNPC
jgi:hypothetical protein